MEIDPPLPPNNGPVWASILAAGVGCATLGVLVDLTEAFKSVSRLLAFYTPTGDLSGKTTVALVVWLITWALLHRRWKDRALPSTGRIFAATLALLAIAFLAVFPPIFGLL